MSKFNPISRLALPIAIFLVLLSPKNLHAQTNLEWASVLLNGSNTSASSDKVFANDSYYDPVSGNLYVVGVFEGENFPLDGGGSLAVTTNNVLVMAIDPIDNTIIWKKIFGGSGDDEGQGIYVDAAGDIFITGFTQSTDFPINGTTPAYQSTLNGSGDHFVMRLNSDASIIKYSSYIGTSEGDIEYEQKGIAVVGDKVYGVIHTFPTNATDIPATGYVSPGFVSGFTVFGLNTAVSGTAGLENVAHYGFADISNYEIDIWGIEQDATGNIYIASNLDSRVTNDDMFTLDAINNYSDLLTYRSDLPTSNIDIPVVTKFNADLSSLLYASPVLPLLNNEFDGPYINYFLDVDAVGNIYTLGSYYSGMVDTYTPIAGTVNIYNENLLSNGYSSQYSALTKISKNNPSEFEFISLLPGEGNGTDFGGLSVDDNGCVHSHYSVDPQYGGSPITNGSLLTEPNGSSVDWYYSVFDTNGVMKYSSMINNSASVEDGNSMTINKANGTAYLFQSYDKGSSGTVSSVIQTPTYYNSDLGTEITVVNGNQGIVQSEALNLLVFASQTLDSTNTISATQTACISGATEVIRGTDMEKYFNFLYDGSSTSRSYGPIYQWQVSTDNTVWADVIGASLKDYLPPPTSLTIYYRRIGITEGCAVADTSNVHTLVINTDDAPQLDEGTTDICNSTDVVIGEVATGGSGDYSYTWSPATNLSATNIAQPTFNGNEGGIYTVTVTDNITLCEFIEGWQVMVTDASAGLDTSACIGQGVPIGTPGIPGGNFTYSWTSISGDPVSTLSNANTAQPIANPMQTTVYELTMTIVDQGCSTTSQVTVAVNNPSITPSADQIVCFGETITLGGEVSQPGYSYTWAPGLYISDNSIAQPDFSASLCPSDDENSLTDNPITYMVTKEDDVSGCVVYDTIDVYVIQAELYNNISMCGSAVTIGTKKASCGLDLPLIAYSWSVLSGDASSIVGQENSEFPTVNPSSVTTYQLDVLYDGVAYCSDTVRVADGCGGGCYSNITATSEIECPVGGQYNTTLQGSISYPGDPDDYSFEWVPTTGLASPTSLTTEVNSLGSDQIYRLSVLRNSDGAEMCYNEITVYANPASNPNVDIEGGVSCSANPIQIGGSSVAGYTYSWTPITGLDDPNISNPIATISETTEYMLETTDLVTGCVFKDTVVVTLQNPVINAGDDATFCDNAIVQLGTLAQPHHTYSWTPSAGLSQPNIAQPLDTLYTSTTFTLLVTDTLTGCSITDDIVFTITSPPTYDAPDVTACVGADVQVGLPEILGYTYNWSPTTGLDDPSAAQPILSNVTETTTLTVVVSDGNAGCVTTDQIVVNIGGSYTLDAPDAEICNGGSTTIGVVDAGGSYVWTPGDGLSATNVSMPSANPSTTTTYTLTWTTPDGCDITDEIILTVNPLPSPDMVDVSICEGTSTTIGIDDDGSTYTWSIAAGPGPLPSPSNTAELEVSPTGNTTYQLDITDGNGCTATDQIIITINTTPDLDLGVDLNVCGSALLKPINTGETVDTWSWSTGESEDSISVNPIEVTTYMVSGYTADGCVDSDTIILTPGAFPNAGVDKEICEGETTAIGTPDDTGGSASYSWSIASGPGPLPGISNTAQLNVTPTATTEYELSVTEGACTLKDTVEVTVNSAPSVDLGTDQIICSGSCITIGVPNTMGYTYAWSPSAGTSDPTSSEVQICPSANIKYELFVTNTFTGCQSSDEINISITSDPLPIAEAGNDVSFCNGGSVQLGNGNGVAGVAYVWTPSTGLSNPYIAAPIAFPSATTTYIVAATSETTYCTAYDTVVVSINSNPSISFAAINPICQGSSGQINTSVSPSSSDYTYSWTPANLLEDATVQDPIITQLDESTTFTVTVLNTLTGCSNASQITIAPVASTIYADAGLDMTVCQNDDVIIGMAELPGTSNPPVIGGGDYSESFESDLGSWVQGTNGSDDDIDWVRDSGGTPSSSTGPTSGADGSFYMFTESSGTYNKTAILTSPDITLSGGTTDMSFGYHMYGSAIGSLTLEVSTDGGATWPTTLWTLSGNQGNVWVNEIIDMALYSGTTIKIRFVGVTGTSYTSDIAFDNIQFQAGSPVTYNYTYEWKSASQGSSFYSSSAFYFADGNRSDSEAKPKTSSSSYDRTYQLIVTDLGTGCKATDYVDVTVEAKATIDAGTDQILCDVDGNLAASATGSGSGIWSQISGPNTATISAVNDPVSGISGLIDGAYTFRWTVSGDICNPGYDEVTIQMSTPPTLVINTIGICGLNTVDLTDASVLSGSTNYTQVTYWLDEALTTQAPSPANAPVPGSYYIKLANNLGCTTAGQVTFDADCGVIGNRIWLDENGDGVQDAGEPGIPNIVVELQNGTCSAGVDCPTTTTDLNGGYIFIDLEIGSYTVAILSGIPTGVVSTYDEDSGTTNPDATTIVNIANGDEHMSADFGYNYNTSADTDSPSMATTGSLGDRIWNDANGDGVQDPGESGITNVTVTLYNDSDGDGIYDNVVSTTTTDESGNYIFDGLVPAAYVLSVDDTSLPFGFATSPTGDPDGDATNISEPIVVAPGDVVLIGDFGYQSSTGSTIGDLIFVDADGDGIQDTGEPGIEGVTIALEDASGNVIATTTTDANGNYSFPDLADATYNVIITDTENVLGELSPITDPDGGNDMTSTVVLAGVDNLVQDFGFAPTGHTAGDGLIGNQIYIDTNNDGVLTTDEGVEGVVVELYAADETTLVATTTTDENGNYLFGGLDATATYVVKVEETTLPGGDVYTNMEDPDAGTTGESTVDLSATAGVNLDQDFGYEATTPVMISGNIWEDTDADGIGVGVDISESTVFAGVSVILTDATGNIIATTISDANGDYSFNNIPTGMYTVSVEDVNDELLGYWHSLGTDSEPSSTSVDATGGNVSGVDFGYYQNAASIGNYVWNDVNGNGIQDVTETGIEGVTVTLEIDYNGDGTPEITMVDTTDANGHYSFNNLLLDEDYAASGTVDYTISAATPTGYLPTIIDVNTNGNDLEDADDPTGVLATVTQGNENTTTNADPTTESTEASYDFGFKSTNTTHAIYDFNNTPYETDVVGDVTINDFDREGDTQSTFTLFGSNGGMPLNEGSVTMSNDGTYLYEPPTGYSGETSFTYEVCDDGTPVACDTAIVYIEVLPPVSAEGGPIIANPDANTIETGATATGNVISNDFDPDERPFAVSSPLVAVTVPGVDEDGNIVADAGTLTLNPDGTYEFTPTGLFTGVVTQPYTISTSGSPGVTDNTILEITVIGDNGNSTFANDDANVTDIGVPVSDDVIINDKDVEADSIMVTAYNFDSNGDGNTESAGTLGVATTVGGNDDTGAFVANAGDLVLNGDGTYTFTPTGTFVGNVIVTYTLCDTITPTPACDEATLVITVLDVKRDYGDGPAVYGDAWHRALTDTNEDDVLDGATDVWLGTNTDFEYGQSTSETAEGDSNDEALEFGSGTGDFPPVVDPLTSYDIDIAVSSSSSSDVVFYGLWIDWDEDGSYDDFYSGSQTTTAGSGIATVSVTTPASVGFVVNVRLRADDDPFTVLDSIGAKTNGEVEDYQSAIALPVELISFDGIPTGCDVQLNWVSAIEENFSHYEVEWSEDGTSFSKRETIQGNGNNSTEKYYQYIDKSAFENNYYRLKLVDLDGSFEYSKTIIVKTDCSRTDFDLYPNPIARNRNDLTVEFEAKSVETTFFITDMLGRTLQQVRVETIPGYSNTVLFDISNFPSGTYIMKAEGYKVPKTFVILE